MAIVTVSRRGWAGCCAVKYPQQVRWKDLMFSQVYEEQSVIMIDRSLRDMLSY